ncbi:MAG: class I SAM-dependent methyltransferase [Clostridia bacterium]|nr:class I SAM-dependent methyltransferase [Clostridia bacterium]
MSRISTLCSYLDNCNTFADVACDHGYLAQYMLKNNLCEKAIISDISDKSLDKARALLKDYIKSGKCTAVCCDGLKEVKGADLVMIAGIGGDEILKILKDAYIPRNFVFQPMKNAQALRAYLLQNGCKITSDDIFSDGKNYYFVIKGSLSNCVGHYNEYQLAYGRDSLFNPILKEYLTCELDKKLNYLSAQMSEQSRTNLEKDIKFIRGVLENEPDVNT